MFHLHDISATVDCILAILSLLMLVNERVETVTEKHQKMSSNLFNCCVIKSIFSLVTVIN